MLPATYPPGTVRTAAFKRFHPLIASQSEADNITQNHGSTEARTLGSISTTAPNLPPGQYNIRLNTSAGAPVAVSGTLAVQ